MIRPLPAQHYIKISRAAGHSLQELLRGTGIDYAELDNPRYFVSQNDYETLLKNIIELNGDNGVGLYIGTHNRLADYGLLAYAGMSGLSVAEGIENTWGRFGPTLGVMAKPTINRSINLAGLVCIEFTVPWFQETLYRFSVEEALCVLRYFGKELVGSAPEIARIELSFPRPTYHEKYGAIFNCPIQFGAVCTRVLVAEQWINSPLLTTDEEVHRICTERLNYILRLIDSQGPTISKVRDALVASINQPPSLAQMAAQFGISPRSLSRHLAKQGTNYRELVEDTRMELTSNLLNTTRLSTKEIAYRLGYTNTGAFRRAFKSWSGLTIQEFCQQAQIDTDTEAESSPPSEGGPKKIARS